MPKISVVSNVLQANDAAAAENRALMQAAGVVAVNIISAPGSGKTTLLQQTIPALAEGSSAVLVGDLQTSRDAERLADVAAATVQINTGSGCHLSAEQVAAGLGELDLTGLDFVFIENVGNMVCPVSFDLGEHARVALLSVPEGDDKVAKYHTLFQAADVIVLNKVDLLGILDFDLDRVRDDIAQVNTRAPFVQLSAKSGEGMDEWLGWLRALRGH
ncbi:MAG: hydrogenase nickel incorporation protein HypB [Lentisphaerae bacterium]|jgi:hydrogenase nickel incorporation protein HypB|nr:hydrogenase nickel incorporation protein HypB [Lentisphaerota bacterium]MBT4819573.1 hydrogenase nickel incorporation protein HypB [Lentisphaerota bacterium]MBT5609661.1 hydrogenase nickel incorporation protein HypB [Lentisphaerota bacterium]MBT7055261.1 hydrogenase nickel incorporation protein HypB [Lentisphaerota bacterium]MBT7841391.1 hydrogenase nickel incorporation protein HypB [Lentisphaerota bacterium]